MPTPRWIRRARSACCLARKAAKPNASSAFSSVSAGVTSSTTSRVGIVHGKSVLRAMLMRRTATGSRSSLRAIAAILAQAHRPLERTRNRSHGQFLAIERDLLPETAADIRADHRHLRLAQPQAAGELGTVGMRHLVADMHGQVSPTLVPHGAAPA